MNVKINSLVAGSPKGVYSTVSDLTSAYPSGNENTYVVNADGGWYYWNGTAWILGGIYQDTCIDETNPVIFKIKKDLTNVFGDTPLSAALTTKDGYYFGLTHGDRESSVYKKITFKTELGKIYYISTVVQNNIPLLKLNGVYYPTTTGSDTTLERKSTYVIGDGGTISINCLTAKGYTIYEYDTPIQNCASTNKKVLSLSMKETLKNMFVNGICCGDSLTRGYYSAQYPNDDGSLPTYPKELAKITGWTCLQAGKSGIDAIEWWNTKYSLFDFTDKDFAIIFLGTNKGITNDFNTVTDGSTEGSAYCKIIEGIQGQNADCKIFLLTCFATSGEYADLKTTNTAIKNIASKYDNVYLLDFQNNDYFDVNSTDYHDTTDLVHFLPIGYKMMANTVYNLMVESFYENIKDYDTPLS